MPKFFVDPTQIVDGKIEICGNDASHISFSLRMAKGDRIFVCDGQETEYECVLAEFLPDCVIADVVSRRAASSESPVKIYLYQALPKGDKLETVIQKAVECGVFEVIPFESERCVVKAKADAEERKTIRRNRIAEEAAKQSGRGYVPKVSPTLSFDAALNGAAAADLSLICYEDETGMTLKNALVVAKQKKIASISLMIGSEGGFSAKEVEKAKNAGILAVSLGKRILRTETAPIFALGGIAYEFEL